MNAELRERLMRQLIRYEGKRNRMYADSEGVATIGIGHNLQSKSISDAAVAQIFTDDVNDVERDVERELPWVAALSLPRQAVMYDMTFNLGIEGLLEFHATLDAIQAERWEDAARHMLASKWARQVGRRAEELADQMRSGEWRAQ
jgi:lysozyme